MRGNRNLIHVFSRVIVVLLIEFWVRYQVGKCLRSAPKVIIGQRQIKLLELGNRLGSNLVCLQFADKDCFAHMDV